MTKNQKLILATIFFLGLFFRVYRLNLNIPELYSDEVGQYQNIITSSQPLSLNPFQLFNQTIHALTSFIWIFGLTPLGVRLASAFYGAFIPLSVYYMASSLTKKDKQSAVPLIAALLTAFLPWSFMISRIGHAHIPLVTILSCCSIGLYAQADQLRNKLLSLILILLAIFFYPSVLFILPSVALIYLLETNSLKKLRKNPVPAFFTLAISAIAALIIVLKYKGLSSLSRGIDLAIWRDPNTVYLTDKYRGLSWLSRPDFLSFNTSAEKIAAPLLYNQFTANLNIFFKNYLSFFSPDFLFLRGDPILRHSTGQFGSFYLFLLPFLLVGAYAFFLRASKTNKYLVLAWLLASPLTAAITKDGAGYILRAITLLPILTFFIAVGIAHTLTWLKTKTTRFLFTTLLATLFLYSTYGFLFSYFHVYPYQTETARSFEYGFRDLADFQTQNDSKPMLIIWDGYHPQYHFFFWQQLSPKEYKQLELEDIVVGETHFYHPSPNLYFAKPFKTKDVSEFISVHKPTYLVLPDPYFVKYPTDLVPEAQPEKTIYYPNHEVNFRIYSTDHFGSIPN